MQNLGPLTATVCVLFHPNNYHHSTFVVTCLEQVSITGRYFIYFNEIHTKVHAKIKEK